MSTSAPELYAELLSKNKFITHVLNSTVDIISVLDREGNRVFANNAISIILGVQKNELIGYSIFDVVYEEDKIKTFNVIKRVQEQKVVSNFENRLVKKDGSLVYMSWTLHWDEDTGFIYITGRNITAVKLATAALEESEKRFRVYIENATDALFVHDFDGNFTDVNRAACKSLGYTREELLTMSISDIDKEIDLEYAKDAWKKTLKNEPVTLQTNQIKKDGSKIPVEVRFGFFEMDGRQRVMGFVRDISARKLSEDQLKASEKKYKQLFDFSGTGNFLIDTDGIFLDVNKRAASLFNAKPEDVTGKNLRDFFDPETANKYIQFVREIIENGGSRKYEDTFTILGVERTFMITDCAIQNNEGKNFAMLSISHDITERKQAELKLEDNEKRFRAIIQNLSVGIVKYRPNAEVMICNTAALKMMGLTEQQLREQSPKDAEWKVIHEDGAEFPFSAYPVTIALSTGKSVYNVIMGIYRPLSKDIVWLLVNAIPQFFDDGQLECVTVTFADITEKKKMEAEIAAQLKRYRVLMHTSQDFIQILDGKGKLLEWNDAFAKHLGYPEEKIARMYAWDWSPGFTKEAVIKILAGVKDEGISFEAQHLLNDGSTRSVDVKLNRFLSDGKYFYYASARDITELKNKQKEIEKLNEELRGLSIYMQNLIEKERADLANEIHGEFGQTFVAISMNAELISQKIKDKNEELTALIKDQINMSHKVISSSRMMFNSLYPTMLEDLGLIAAIESFLETGNLKFCSFKFDLNTNIRDEVVPKSISLVLYRIFQESMTNIALYAKANKVTADIFCNGENITMRIADNGTGFDIAAVNTKEHHGLLVMRERAYAMNGSFTISSVLLEGTVIEVVIPLERQQANENFF